MSPFWLPFIIVGSVGLLAMVGLLRYRALIALCNRVHGGRRRVDMLLRERATPGTSNDDARRTSIEEKIAEARAAYDRDVIEFNTRIETYPDAFFAHALNLMPAELWDTAQFTIYN